MTEHLCKHGNYHCNICEVELLNKVVEEYKTENERIKKWETFDGQMKALFMENHHMGESSITIADYMQAQLDLGIIEKGDFSNEPNIE